MSVPTISYLHGINFPGGQFVGQLTDLTPSSNIKELTGYAAGHPDPLFQGSESSKPEIVFRTPQIATILTLCGGTFCADLSGGNTDCYYKLGADFGVRTPNASFLHERFRMNQGFLYWTEISANQEGTAEISCRIVPTWDGTNLPLIPAGAQALVGTSLAAEWYRMGPVKINGSTFGGGKSWRLSLGIDTVEEGSDGDEYISFCGIRLRNPMLEMSSLDIPTAWNTYGIPGLALSSLTAYLRRAEPDQNRAYVDAALQHISLAATNGQVHVMNNSGGAQTPGQASIKARLRPATSAAAILTVTTGVAII